MAQHNEIGKLGELLASKCLESKGLEILEKNWRHHKAEIDIIAKDGEVLVFVEVKTRTSTFYGEPAEFITPRKERLLIDAATAYMESINYNWEIRFDVIGVVLNPQGKPDIQYYQDAFFPGLE